MKKITAALLAVFLCLFPGLAYAGTFTGGVSGPPVQLQTVGGSGTTASPYIPAVGIMDPGGVNQASVTSSGAFLTSPVPIITNGLTPYFNDAVAGTVQQIKSTAGNIYFLNLLNTTAAAAYLQIFFLPSASVTVGTTTPNWTIRLAANERQIIHLLIPTGSTGTGLSVAGTTTATGSTGAAVSVSALYF